MGRRASNPSTPTSQSTVMPSPLLFLLVVMAGGCAGSAGETPRHRIGALPFPGTFTLYNAVDPDDLGPHRYGRMPRVFEPEERERGIIYTTRAGFLDLAHLRITIDWTRYYAGRVRAALAERRERLALPSLDGATFHVALRYPADWDDLPLAERDALADELALRCGQRLAYHMMTWHELITWFGHRRVALIDESPSAFTYDDGMSHVVGLRVAERAIRACGVAQPFASNAANAAVTTALREELAELGAVSRGETDRAARAVEGAWWSRGRPLKRQLDVGLSDGVVRPWLVSDVALAGEVEGGESFVLPELDDVLGRDFTAFCSVQIEPNIAEAKRMRALLPDKPDRFDAERDLPLLAEAARRQMRQRFAADVDRPWTQPAAAAAAAAGGAAAPEPARPARVSAVRAAFRQN